MPVSFEKQQQQQQHHHQHHQVHYSSPPPPNYSAHSTISTTTAGGGGAGAANLNHSSSGGYQSQNQQSRHAAGIISQTSSMTSPESGGVSVCTICSSVFPDAAQLKKHSRAEHPKDKPYPCPECGMRFTRRDHMARHLRKHQGIYPYHCSYCQKSFTRKDSWMKHERWHAANPFSSQPTNKGTATKTEKEIESLAVSGLQLLSGVMANSERGASAKVEAR